MKLVRVGWLALLAGAVLSPGWGSAGRAVADDAAAVSFSKDVAPVLMKRCMACHGQTQPKGGYQLHTFEALMKAGDSSSAPVTAGDLDDSELYRLIVETDKDAWMPKEGDRMPDAEIALVKRWIEQGAKFDGPDVKATLASIVPTQYDAAPEAYRVPIPVTAVAFHPEGAELATAGYNEIAIWNVADGALVRRIPNVLQRVHSLAYNADGSLLAVAAGTPGQLGEVKLLNPATGETVKTLGTMSDVAFGVAFSPAGDKVAACAADRSIRVYDVASGKEEVAIEDHADWVMAVAWSPDGAQLASASRDKTSKVFDAKTGESQITYNGHGNTVFGVAFSTDGKQVLTSGADRKIHAWNPADAKKIGEMPAFGNEVYQLIREGDVLVACSADKTAREFTISNRAAVRTYTGHADWVYSLAYHPGTKRVATGGFDGEVRIWNAEDGKEVLKFFAAPGYKTAAN